MLDAGGKINRVCYEFRKSQHTHLLLNRPVVYSVLMLMKDAFTIQYASYVCVCLCICRVRPCVSIGMKNMRHIQITRCMDLQCILYTYQQTALGQQIYFIKYIFPFACVFYYMRSSFSAYNVCWCVLCVCLRRRPCVYVSRRREKNKLFYGNGQIFRSKFGFSLFSFFFVSVFHIHLSPSATTAAAHCGLETIRE